jgi:hypothetical protein
MAVEIDTRITPALDPETYRAVPGYNDDTRGYVDEVVGAFNDIYVTLGKVHDARTLAERPGPRRTGSSSWAKKPRSRRSASRGASTGLART